MDTPSPESFDNEPVRASEIPDHRAVTFECVPETFRRYALISTLVFWVPVLLAPLAMHLLGDVPVLLARAAAGVLFALTLLTALYRWVDAGFRGWALRDHDLIARQGVLWRSVIALPIARIQHVETTSGPLERSHGLARLKLFTAGGMTADLTVIGLTGDTADRLREHLVEQIRLRDAGDADGSPTGADPDDADGDELESR